MGSGCTYIFNENKDDGLKRRKMWLPPALQEIRRDALALAQEVARGRHIDIPEREFEAAFLDGTWRSVLSPLETTINTTPMTREPVRIYNRTLWDMRDFMRSTMLGGELGPVRLFYAMLE